MQALRQVWSGLFEVVVCEPVMLAEDALVDALEDSAAARAANAAVKNVAARISEWE